MQKDPASGLIPEPYHEPEVFHGRIFFLALLITKQVDYLLLNTSIFQSNERLTLKKQRKQSRILTEDGLFQFRYVPEPQMQMTGTKQGANSVPKEDKQKKLLKNRSVPVFLPILTFSQTGSYLLRVNTH